MVMERGAMAGSFLSFSAVVLFGVSRLSGKLITRIEALPQGHGDDLVRVTTLGVMRPQEHEAEAVLVRSAGGDTASPFRPVKVGQDVLFMDQHKGAVHDVGRLRELLRAKQ